MGGWEWDWYLTEIKFFEVGRGVSLLNLLTYDTQTLLYTLIIHMTLHTHTCTNHMHIHTDFLYPCTHLMCLMHSCAHLPLVQTPPIITVGPLTSPHPVWDLHVLPGISVHHLDTHTCTHAPLMTHISRNYQIWSRPRPHDVVPKLPMKRCPIQNLHCCYVSLFILLLLFHWCLSTAIDSNSHSDTYSR
jgi:hypothetical protein